MVKCNPSSTVRFITLVTRLCSSTSPDEVCPLAQLRFRSPINDQILRVKRNNISGILVTYVGLPTILTDLFLDLSTVANSFTITMYLLR